MDPKTLTTYQPTKTPWPLYIFWVLLISLNVVQQPLIYLPGMRGMGNFTELITIMLLIFYGLRFRIFPIVMDKTTKLLFFCLFYGTVVGYFFVHDQYQFQYFQLPIFGFFILYYSCLYLFMNKYPTLIKVTIYTIIITAIVLSVIALFSIAHIGPFSMYNSFSTVRQDNVSLASFSQAALRRMRYTGFFRNANQTAFFLVSALALSYLVFIKKYSRKFFIWPLFTGIFAIILYCVIKTGSHAANVALAFTTLVLTPKKYRRYAILAGILLAIISFDFSQSLFNDVTKSLSDSWVKNDDHGYRSMAYVDAIRWVFKTFLLGSGFATWKYEASEVHCTPLDLTLFFGLFLGLKMYYELFLKYAFFTIRPVSKQLKFSLHYSAVFIPLAAFSLFHLIYRQRILWQLYVILYLLSQWESRNQHEKIAESGL
jgi:hypothetical protein